MTVVIILILGAAVLLVLSEGDEGKEALRDLWQKVIRDE